MRKRLTVIMLLAVLACGTIAYAKAETSVINHFGTGVVDIDLKEYTVDENGKETEWKDGLVVMPGTFVSKIPRITNAGADCYVRAKLEFDTDGIEEFSNLGSGWKKYPDGYYYCDTVLPSGETTTVFDGFKIPDDFDHKGAFTLTVTADAVQETNFVPDWESDSPWGNIEIQECIKEGPYTVNSVKQVIPLTIEYDLGSLKASPKDFFVNFNQMMPGDHYHETVSMRNGGKDVIKLFFRQEAENDDLLDKITLKIWSENKQIFDGNMGSMIAEQEIAVIEPGDTEEFTFEIDVPKELDNEYTLRDEMIHWYFSVDEKKSVTDIVGDIVKTGDSIPVMAVCGLVISAGMIVFIRRKKHEEN